MSIDWLRDLIIVIFGLVATGVLIFLAVLVYLVYRRASSIMKSVATISKTVEGISSYAGDEVLKPMIQVVSFIQGLSQGINAISKVFKRKKGGRDE